MPFTVYVSMETSVFLESYDATICSNTKSCPICFQLWSRSWWHLTLIISFIWYWNREEDGQDHNQRWRTESINWHLWNIWKAFWCHRDQDLYSGKRPGDSAVTGVAKRQRQSVIWCWDRWQSSLKRTQNAKFVGLDRRKFRNYNTSTNRN